MICLRKINDFHTTTIIVTMIIVHRYIHHHRAVDGHHHEIVVAVEAEEEVADTTHTHQRCGLIHVPQIRKDIQIWTYSSQMWWCNGLIPSMHSSWPSSVLSLFYVWFLTNIFSWFIFCLKNSAAIYNPMQPPPPLPRDRPPDAPPPPPPHDSMQSRRNMNMNRNMNRSPRNSLRPDHQGYAIETEKNWPFSYLFIYFSSKFQVYESRTI